MSVRLVDRWAGKVTVDHSSGTTVLLIKGTATTVRYDPDLDAAAGVGTPVLYTDDTPVLYSDDTPVEYA